MDDNKFINLKTFEITDNIPNYISVDKSIAKAIAVLNKKGYKTINSCGGHFYQHTKTLQKDVDLDLLEDAKNHTIYSIDEVRDDGFDCWVTHTITSIYVMFDKDYNFQSLPKDFELETNKTLRHTVELFSSNNKRKKDEQIFNEIEKYNKILEDWANNLPDIN